MANLRFTLTLIAVGLILAALALGWFAPVIISWVPDEVDAPHLFLAAFVFVGLCGVAFYSLMECSLNPVLSIIDEFTRMRAGDLHPRLPVEGPEEMRRMALGFNDMVEDLETQVRDLEVEKQASERARVYLQDQLDAVVKFRSLADSAPLGLILADADLRVVYQNDTSESVLLQLNDHLDIDATSLNGERVASLYPDVEDATRLLTNPDHLPYECSFDVGPHRVRFVASAVFDEESEFIGPSIFWEVLMPATDESVVPQEASQPPPSDATPPEDEDPDFKPIRDPNEGIDEDILAEVEALESMEEEDLLEETGFELIEDETQEEDAIPQNGSHPAMDPDDVQELKRGASLVTRSVRVLGERLSGVRSSIQALSSEGDSLRRSIDDVRQHVERTGEMAAERSESLWDLVEGAREATTYSEMVREAVVRLKGKLNESETTTQSIARLQSSIEHLVVSAKVELGRAEEPAGGLAAVVEAISDLSPEVARLQRDVEGRMMQIRRDLDEMASHLEGSGWSARQTGRLAKRGGTALERLARDVEDSTSQGKLLIELADGQAEIRGHIQRQVEELYELIQVTEKVAREQESIVEQADAGASSDGQEAYK
tara:strand:- start:4804 stop:6609 length:1806 start_codon:yes stop_codon:yes gene_type:complete